MDYKNAAEVEVKDVTYEANAEGFFDALHGKFVVHILRDHKDTEIINFFFKCPKGDKKEICDIEFNSKIEDMSCEKFHTDKTGPWAMFAPAIDKRNPCAERQGEFDITYAKIESRYIEKYMSIEEGRYR